MISSTQLKDSFFDNLIDLENVGKIVNNVISRNDGGELFLELYQSEHLALEDGILKNADFNSRQGFGLRAFSAETTALVCSSEINEEEIKRAASAISFIGSNNLNNISKIDLKKCQNNLYSSINPINEIEFQFKVDLLQRVDEYLRSQSPYVKYIKVVLSGKWQAVQILKEDSNVKDIRPLVVFNVTVVLEKNGRKESGTAGHGGRDSYSKFISEFSWKKISDLALNRALTNLEAMPAPAGEMTVVLGAGWPGVLLHEAVGHGLEGDAIRKKTSAFMNSLGKRVASKGVTIVDDGTILNGRGSINIDDEGTASQCNILIEDGILINSMKDIMNAKLMSSNSTGNGRRESYQHTVIPRMTNTYMLAGDNDPQEIISSVEEGLYIVGFGGGQVSIESGRFVISASESYFIKNGKISHPVKGATLIGNGPDILTKVSMIGNDMQLDPGLGSCGKSNQNVPVGVGQPTLKVDSMTVGGTEAIA